jgi:hypothetical protein
MICECVVERFVPGPLPGSVLVIWCDSFMIWPLRRALTTTCPPVAGTGLAHQLA